MNEPKPQTPLTDAAECESEIDWPIECLDHARSLELKLQEAERQRDEAKHWIENYKDLYDEKKKQWYNSVTCVCADMPNVAHYIKQIEAERDQLIKVVDELATSLQEAADTYDEEGFNNANFLMALTAYSLLPHVQAKKGNK